MPDGHDVAFLTFVNDRLLQTTDEACKVRRTLPMPTPLPIDAARSGSMGGRHSKGKGMRKKANTMPVQKSNKVPRSARASNNPARICGSNRTSVRAKEPRGNSHKASVQQNLVGAAAQVNVQRNSGWERQHRPSTKSSLKQGRTSNPAQERVPQASLYRREAVTETRGAHFSVLLGNFVGTSFSIQ